MGGSGVGERAIAHPRVAVHLLGGGADLGVPREQVGEALAEMAALPAAEQRAWLGSGSRDGALEAQHAVMPPISSLLHHGLPAMGDVEVLLLVATAQDPPHPHDTWGLADTVVAALEQDPGLFGHPVATVEVLTVGGLDLATMRNAVAAWMRRWRPAMVVFGSSGAVTGFVGAATGCLEAGVVPRYLPTNRQDRDDDSPALAPFGLRVEADTRRWLARSGYLWALAPLERDAGGDATDLFTLARRQRLEWKPGKAPPVEERRAILDADLVAGFGRRDASTLFLLRPWLDATYTWMRQQERNSDLPRHLDCLPRAVTTVTCRPVLQVGEALAQLPAVNGWSPSPLLELLRHPAAAKVWETGRRADHGEDPSLDAGRDAFLSLRARLPEPPTPWAPLTERALPTPLLASSRWLLVQPVGRRDLQADGATPMLDATLAWAAQQSGACHMRLVASEETLDAAVALQQRAEPHVASLAICCVDPHASALVDEALRAALVDDARLVGCEEVVVAAAMGTKAMALGMLLASARWAFGEMARLRLVNVVAIDGGRASKVEDAGAGGVVRLAHDDAVASLLPLALQQLELGFAADLTDRGSARWDGLSRRLHALDALARRRRRPSDKDLEALLDLGEHPALQTHDGVEFDARLWPARLHLWSHLVEDDPWRALYTVMAIGERCFSSRDGRVRAHAAWGLSWKEQDAGKALWFRRNQSPYGHRPEAAVPSAEELRPLFGQAADEAEARASEANEPLFPREVLLEGWRRVVASVLDLRAAKGDAAAPAGM